jgi:hypothetical protein
VVFDDGGGDGAGLAAVVVGVVARRLEGAVGGCGVAGDQAAFGLFGQRATVTSISRAITSCPGLAPTCASSSSRVCCSFAIGAGRCSVAAAPPPN